VAPRSTYRVQVRPGFDLSATAGLAGYLADLGVTHLYSAPLLAAVPGSEHGYDVVDPGRVNPELGGAAGLEALVEALRDKGLGLVVDIVPNHLGVAVPALNPAWWSLLRDGPASPYASWFDVDWSRGRIVVPILGDGHGPAQLSIVDNELRYFEHRYPLAPGTLGGSPEQVHARQHYELVSWRRANTELNYRRFFAIADLAAVRVERPEVFAAMHAEILRWCEAGWVSGLRVDHPDGLRDPAGYLRRLRAAAPGAWLVVEKVLEAGEELPDWPVHGTTGYEALREVCGVFVDPAGRRAYPSRVSWDETARTAKAQAATTLLATELRRLTHLVPDLAEAGEVLAELAADLPVYRTYLPDGERFLTEALARARKRRPDLPFDALEPRLRDPGDELAVRFQQFTGAVQAKGVEDTAFYRFTRFIALAEVGGAPDRFGVSPEEFHAAARHRLERWPTSMTTLSTHDTKRSEDVRARLAVLSELPEEWHSAVARWSSLSRGRLADPDLAALVWQTVAGAWPIPRERLREYVRKAGREAAVHTSWASPGTDFEFSLLELVNSIYDDPQLSSDVSAFVARLTPYGWVNALGQKLVQLLMPGVPDTYQGTELWDNSLVDPDNRRPVDFATGRALLARLDAGWRPPVDASGAVKLLVTSRALRLRRDRELTGYAPVWARGPAAAHVLAFDRGGVIAVATRLPLGLARRGGWAGTSLPLPSGTWSDRLTGTRFSGPGAPLDGIMARYPVALLVAE
jgi:(1->4)-alpha-D-glucan 1-alpha-D-glucosylmutase